MFIHPYLKGDLTDTATGYVPDFVDIGQDDTAEYGRYPAGLSSSRDELLARQAP
jgi:hypothetical protein